MLLPGGPSTNRLIEWAGLGRKAFCLFSLSRGVQRFAPLSRPGWADGIRGNSWPEPVPCGRELTFPWLREGAAPHSPATFQVGHFLEPRCLLMSWGERLSALYPSSGPHITRPQEAGPGPAGSGFRPVPCASQACRGDWCAAANQVHLRELGDSSVTGPAFPAGAPAPWLPVG